MPGLDKLPLGKDYPSKTALELEQLAQDIFMRRVYTHRNVPSDKPDAIAYIFTVLADTKRSAGRRMMKRAGLLYERLDKAIGQSMVEGHPAFDTVQILNRADAEALWVLHAELETVLQERLKKLQP